MLHQKQADEIIKQLLCVSEEQQRALLAELEKSSPILYCVVRFRIDDLRDEALHR